MGGAGMPAPLHQGQRVDIDHQRCGAPLVFLGEGAGGAQAH